MHKLSLLIAASAMVAMPALADSSNWIVGSWKLVSATQNENGQTRDYFGPNPLGTVMFGPDGHFTDIIIRSDIPKFAIDNRTRGTAEENADVVKGSIAFYGTYTLDGDSLQLHIVGSSFPNWNGTGQERIVHLTGNQFTWENAHASGGGGAKLIWQRMGQ
jgi:hypothetical protein